MYLKFRLMIFIKQEKIERYYLKHKHPLLMTRGVPGTHDIDLMLKFLKKLSQKNLKV